MAENTILGQGMFWKRSSIGTNNLGQSTSLAAGGDVYGRGLTLLVVQLCVQINPILQRSIGTCRKSLAQTAHQMCHQFLVPLTF